MSLISYTRYMLFRNTLTHFQFKPISHRNQPIGLLYPISLLCKSMIGLYMIWDFTERYFEIACCYYFGMQKINTTYTAQKWSSPLRISSVNVTFTEEIFNGKLDFWCTGTLLLVHLFFLRLEERIYKMMIDCIHFSFFSFFFFAVFPKILQQLLCFCT